MCSCQAQYPAKRRNWQGGPCSLERKGVAHERVPEFGLPSCLHLSIVPVIDLLQATLQPLLFRRPVALHPANSLRHSGFASHDFFALRRRRSRALQIETQLGVLGPGRFDEARITLGDGPQPAAQQRLFGRVSPLTFDTLGTGDDDQGRDPASRIASAQRSARQAGLENLLQFGN